MSTTLDHKQLGYLLGAIPGSTDPAIWTIRHSQGADASVDLEGHDALIPGSLTPWDAAVTQHEQSHVRWDLPLSKLGALAPALVMPSVLPWYKMMREWVVDLRLVLAGETDPTATDPRIGMDRFDWAAMPDPATMSEETLAQRWCQFAYVYTGSKSVPLRNHTGEIWSLLNSTVQALLTAAYAEVTDRANAYNDDISATWALKLAAHWDATRTQPAPPPPPTTQEYKDATNAANQSGYANAATAELLKQAMAPAPSAPSAEMQAAAQSTAQAMAPTTAQGDATNGQGADVAQTFASTPRTVKGPPTRTSQKSKAGPKAPTVTRWRDDVIICDHLSLARPGKRLKAPKGASEEGVVMVDLPRVFQDGRPFKAASRPAGTIIVDTSGSMDWTAAQLEEIIRRAPGVTVGMYNANGSPSGPNKDGARICIVARGGRCADIKDWEASHQFSGGNNGSDAPALRWLADRHQSGPKFIISDGEFWSNERNLTDYVRNVCPAIMKAGKILRVPTLDDMVRVANHRPAMLSDGGQFEYASKRRANNR